MDLLFVLGAILATKDITVGSTLRFWCHDLRLFKVAKVGAITKS